MASAGCGMPMQCNNDAYTSYDSEPETRRHY
eukprot:CAMPEP_0178665318 /NCGR_PEP_ID=MMETSP0698-20121128/29886_1 /TAXON_ID=265572 /ORGANISM="Extubocellulus spinifer, Strain CCMP396" /LENGTH=30 /DNA_ID= /DNA_START= /DNA_END= /DNA_ORIENTATION=